MIYRRLALFCLSLSYAFTLSAQTLYKLQNGVVRFQSEAPSEFISAYSNKLTGNIDLKSGVFEFKLAISSFKGFSCALLRLHFNANCMETISYPIATFSGTLLDNVDPSKEGEYMVRAKGKLKIHGVEQYRIVKVYLTNKGGQVSFNASIPVIFNDFHIRIPKVWVKRVASKVSVDVAGVLSIQPVRLSLK